MQKRMNDNYYPTSILDIPNTVRGKHPTEKPLSLFSYLLLTYFYCIIKSIISSNSIIFINHKKQSN